MRAFDPAQLDYLSTDAAAHARARLGRRGRRRRPHCDGPARSPTDHHRTHVTSYLYTHPDDFRIAGFAFTPPCDDLRVTLDEPADAELLDAIVAELGAERARQWRDVTRLLRARPDLVAINRAVRQKEVEEG